MKLIAAALAFGVLGGGTLQATLTAATHTPKINTHWSYTVTAKENGKPVAARITVQLVDPLGGVHPVQFGANTKNVTNFAIKGTFKDYVIWPKSAAGVPLTLRVKVVAGSAKKTLKYAVTPHS